MATSPSRGFLVWTLPLFALAAVAFLFMIARGTYWIFAQNGAEFLATHGEVLQRFRARRAA